MIPQIFTVTPTTGSSMGSERVTIRGYGFRVPVSEVFSVDESDNPPEPTTVRVTFNGEECPFVVVFSEEEAVVVSPRYQGPADSLPDYVNVVLSNLDDTGAVITGEVATRVDAFQYHRPSLVDEGPLQWLTRQVVQDLQRHICPNVEMGPSPDYSEDPTAGMVAVSELPVLVLDGPTTRPASFGRAQVNENTETSLPNGDVAEDQRPLCRDVFFGIIMYARSKTEAMNLQSVAEHYFERCPTLDVLSGPGGSRIALEWSASPARASDQPANKLYSVEMDLTIAGVLLGASLGPTEQVEVSVSEDTDDVLVLTDQVKADDPEVEPL